MAVRPYRKRSGELIPGVWHIDFYPEGRNGRRAIFKYPEQGTCSFEEALEFEKVCRRINSEDVLKHSNPRVIDCLPLFLEWYKLHRAEKTYSDFSYSLKWLLPVFGNLQINRITQYEINQYKRLRKCGPRSINKELTYLSSLLSWAHRNGMCDKPLKIEMLPYRRPIPNPPTAEELRSFLAQITDPQKRAMILLMALLGMRYSEVAKLTWAQVTQERIVVVGKGSKQRILPMPPEVWELLKDLPQEGIVFPNKEGVPYGSLKKLFNAACRRAGIRHITPHMLRHALATDVLSTTGDLRLVQILLGHSSVTTTQIYTQVSSNRISDALTLTQKARNL